MVIRETTAALEVLLFFKFIFKALSYVLIENGAFAIAHVSECSCKAPAAMHSGNRNNDEEGLLTLEKGREGRETKH